MGLSTIFSQVRLQVRVLQFNFLRVQVQVRQNIELKLKRFYSTSSLEKIFLSILSFSSAK